MDRVKVNRALRETISAGYEGPKISGPVFIKSDFILKNGIGQFRSVNGTFNGSLYFEVSLAEQRGEVGRVGAVRITPELGVELVRMSMPRECHAGVMLSIANGHARGIAIREDDVTKDQKFGHWNLRGRKSAFGKFRTDQFPDDFDIRFAASNGELMGHRLDLFRYPENGRLESLGSILDMVDDKTGELAYNGSSDEPTGISVLSNSGWIVVQRLDAEPLIGFLGQGKLRSLREWLNQNSAYSINDGEVRSIISNGDDLYILVERQLYAAVYPVKNPLVPGTSKRFSEIRKQYRPSTRKS